MNERIKELVKQSGLDYDELWTKDQLAVEKFAELIVEDCLFKVRVEAAEYLSPDWRDNLVNNIREHFGVEK